MKETVFVIGGCRSGKSRYALEYARNIPGKKKIFIATCRAYDDEMKQRIARHQKERSRDWITVEEPLQLPKAIAENSQKADLVIVDCLTLWVSNLLMETEDIQSIEMQIQHLIRAIRATSCPLVLVSNEVGAGIVPENRLARIFRDLTGFVNQAVADCVGKVFWMVAGIPVTIK